MSVKITVYDSAHSGTPAARAYPEGWYLVEHPDGTSGVTAAWWDHGWGWLELAPGTPSPPPPLGYEPVRWAPLPPGLS